MFPLQCQTWGMPFVWGVAQCSHTGMEVTLVEFLACLWIYLFGWEQRTQGRTVQHWAVFPRYYLQEWKWNSYVQFNTLKINELHFLSAQWQCLCRKCHCFYFWHVSSMNYLWYFISNGVFCSLFVNNEFFMAGQLCLWILCHRTGFLSTLYGKISIPFPRLPCSKVLLCCCCSCYPFWLWLINNG